ncbi:MAG TPA: DJ-1/PfpI family protein [Sphingomicrobium sp.]|nr:DJ-1/PfpI family protein [Sphingomicrobium sp.]
MLRKIAIIVFEDTNLLDVAGPAQVFRTAAEQLIAAGAAVEPPYEIVLLSAGGGAVTSSPGVQLLTTGLADAPCSDFDTVLASGGHGAQAAASNERVLGWLREASGKVRRIGSICTGAFLLAAAGLLHGRRAATHWGYCGELQASYPDVDVDSDSIFVEDAGCWTSAGVTSGMDMALAMVEEDHGRELSLLVARRLVVFLKRPGGQSQFSAPLEAQSTEGPLAPLLNSIVDNPAADLRTEALAERANMSLRNFYRVFEETTGVPPAEWVERARLQIARRLLEQTSKHVEQVADQAGFGSGDRMRRVFLRRLGVSPSDYRARFTRPPSHDAGEHISVLTSTRT